MPPENNKGQEPEPQEPTGEPTNEPTGEPKQPEQNEPEKTVPHERFNQVNEELKDTKARNEFLEQQVQLYQANNPNQQQQQQPKKPKTPLDDISDDDIIEGAQLKRILNTAQSNIEKRLSQLSLQIKYPDLQETLMKKLPEMIHKNPALAQALRTPHAAEVALYELSKVQRGKQQKDSQQAAAEAQKAAEKANSRPPAAGAKSGGGKDDMSWITETSDEEFAAELEKRGL